MSKPQYTPFYDSPYDPLRGVSFPVPTERWNEGNTFVMEFNVQWKPIIVGLLERLQWSDVWQGSDEQISSAVGQIFEMQSEVDGVDFPEYLFNQPDDCTLELQRDGTTVSTALLNLCVESVLSKIFTAPYDSLTPTEQAIRDSIIGAGNDNDGAGYGYENPIIGDSENPILECGDDYIYGMTTQTVDLLHTIVEDFLEFVEGITTNVELVREIADNIPILEVGGIVLDVGIWMQQTAAGAYREGYTQVLRDQIACDLFCYARQNCELTPNQMAIYFSDQASIGYATGIQLGDVLAGIQAVTDPTRMVYSMYLFVLSVLNQGGRFYTIPSSSRFRDYMSTYNNDPDPDWQILCDPCAEKWIHTINPYDTAAYDWEYTAEGTQLGRSQYTYWEAVYVEDASVTGYVFLAFNVPLPSGDTTTQVTRITGSYEGQIGGNSGISPLRYYVESEPYRTDYILPLDGTRRFMDIEPIGEVNPSVYRFSGWLSSAPPEGNLKVYALTFQGTGKNPFV